MSTDNPLSIQFLAPMSDYAASRVRMSHPVIIPTPSTLRAAVYVNAKPGKGEPAIEIDGVFRDGTPAANFTGFFPELEEQFIYLAELMREDFKHELLTPFRVGRDAADLRMETRVTPGATGHIDFEVYLHDYGSNSATETMRIIQDARETGQVDDGGIVSASIITSYSYGEIDSVSCMPRDIARILERRNQVEHALSLLGEDVNLLSLAKGDYPSFPAPTPDDIAARYFNDGYKNVVIMRLGEPYTAGDPAQMFFFDKGTVGL